METLRNQIKLLEKQREEAQARLSEADDARSRSEAALTNLQVVLEQFQLGKYCKPADCEHFSPFRVLPVDLIGPPKLTSIVNNDTFEKSKCQVFCTVLLCENLLFRTWR